MAITYETRKRTICPRLRQLLQVEQSLVFIGVLLRALFAAVKPGAPLLFMAVIILTIGNLRYLR